MDESGVTGQGAFPPTTTHAEWGAGNPHLIVSREVDGEWTHADFPLRADLVSLGADTACDLVLSDADALHATITHDPQDEYVLRMLGKGEMSGGPFDRADPTVPRTAVLRTGARFTIGPWRLVFARDEFADHGVPYGGHQGGEGSVQRLQPPRPDYSQHPEQN